MRFWTSSAQGLVGVARAQRHRGGGPVEPHARDQVLLAVAVHHHVVDQRIVGEAQLDVGGRHVLAAGGDQDVLLAVDDLQEAVVGEAADVAGLEPAVLGERRGGGGRVLVVAGEHAGAARQDLAVVGQLQLDRRQRLAHRVEAERAGAVEGQGRRGLGQAVALDDAARPASWNSSLTSRLSPAPPDRQKRRRPPVARRGPGGAQPRSALGDAPPGRASPSTPARS